MNTSVVGEGKQHDRKKVCAEMNLGEYILRKTAKTSATYRPLKAMQPGHGRLRRGQRSCTLILMGKKSNMPTTLSTRKTSGSVL